MTTDAVTLLPPNAPSSLSFRSETPVQGMAPISPFFFLQSEMLQVFDLHSGVSLATLAPLASLAELALPLTTDFYAVVAGVDTAGTAGILDLVNADSAATQLAADGAVVSALEVLRRATAVRCATMAQEPLRRRAFQEALKRLELKQAFGFVDDATTLLPLFPALLPNIAPVAQNEWLSEEVLGRNVHSLESFVLATMKQQSADPSAVTADSAPVAQKVAEGYAELLPLLRQAHATKPTRFVDVALFHLLLRQDDNAAVAQLLAEPTECTMEDVEGELRNRGMFAALAQFCVSKGDARKALELWRQLGEGECVETGVDGVENTCDFFTRYEGADKCALLEEFLPWVYAKNPERAFHLLTSKSVDVSPIIRPILGLFGDSAYRADFIEFVQKNYELHDSEISTEFATQRIRELQKEPALFDCTLDETPVSWRSRRAEIVTFLRDNADYSPAGILEVLGETLVLERVTVMTRLRHCEEALRLAVYSLRSMRTACECCRIAGMDAWKILLQLLFSETDEECDISAGMRDRKREAFRAAGKRIMVEFAEELDPMMVIETVPDDWSSEEWLPFFTRVIPHSTDRLREGRIRLGMTRWGRGEVWSVGWSWTCCSDG